MSAAPPSEGPASSSGGAPGFVSLVGAGPGDPGLITVRGRRALEEAEVILYDHLASPALLSAIPPGAERAGRLQERIHVGKADGVDFSSQEDIIRLMLKRARAGQRVVRLKGGDPFIFGRGAEEIEALVEASVPFEVIPGVSSAHAAPALAGIPLTHRDWASSYTVVTGHERSDGAGRVDWRALAATPGTLVVLMGVRTAPVWTCALIAHGRSPDTPVAFVRWGTLPRQEVVTTTLGEAATTVATARLRSPAVAVVGEVVRLRETLKSVENQPLFGHVIGLGRDVDDEASFRELERLGATLRNLPLTRKTWLEAGLDAVAALLRAEGAFTDLVFTSANGVSAFRLALERAGLDLRALAGVSTWAVGPRTEAAMWERLGLRADHVPDRATAEGLVSHARALVGSGLDLGPRRFLFPSSARARRVLPDGLRSLGATVLEHAVYDTVPEPSATANLISALDEGLTLITVASPSAVAALAEALDLGQIPRDQVPLAAIGPTTADAARAAGMRVAVTPDTFNLAALSAAIAEAGQKGLLARPSGPDLERGDGA